MSLVAEFEIVKFVGSFEDAFDHFSKILGGEKGGRATSEVNFLDQGPLRKKIAIQIPLFERSFDVGRLYAVPFGDPFVTCAKSAEVLTKGKVNVQADPFTYIAFSKGPYGGLFPVIQVDSCLIPKRDRRVACVPRTGNVIFLNQR
jgi:hypothetical protein